MSEWIDVQDRLPEKDADVLVYCSDTQEQLVAFLTHKGRFQYGVYPVSEDFHGCLVCQPTHWMLLPKPPSSE